MDYTEFDASETLRSQIGDVERQHFNLSQVLEVKRAELETMPVANKRAAKKLKAGEDAPPQTPRELLEQEITIMENQVAELDTQHESLLAQKAKLGGGQ
jgi:hypothetical protein